MELVTFAVVGEGPFYARGSSSNAPGQWWRVGDRAIDVLHECSLTMMPRQVNWGAFVPSSVTRRFGVASLAELEIFLENGALGIRERAATHPPGVYPLMSPVTRAEAQDLVQRGTHAAPRVLRHLSDAAL